MPGDLLGDLSVIPLEPTGAWLSKFIEERIVLDKRMRYPTAAAYDQLALCLLWYRQMYRMQQSFFSEPVSDTRRHYLRLLDDLSRATAAIERERLNWLNTIVLPNPLMTGQPAEDARSDLAALDSLKTAIAAVQGRAFLYAEPFLPEGWHSYAADLAEEFRKAMWSTNPGLPLPASNEGPLTRFLHAFIPYVSGETPKQTAIARHFDRHIEG